MTRRTAQDSIWYTATTADKVSVDSGRNPGASTWIPDDITGAGTTFGPRLCRSPCPYRHIGCGSLRAL